MGLFIPIWTGGESHYFFLCVIPYMESHYIILSHDIYEKHTWNPAIFFGVFPGDIPMKSPGSMPSTLW